MQYRKVIPKHIKHIDGFNKKNTLSKHHFIQSENILCEIDLCDFSDLKIQCMVHQCKYNNVQKPCTLTNIICTNK